MKWIELRITTTQEASDAICDMLSTIGAGGVVIEDPFDIRQQLENPNTLDYADDAFLNSLGEDVIIKSYFAGYTNRQELVELVEEKLKFIGKFLDLGSGSIQLGEIDEEDWSTAWKKHYKPFHISDHLVVKPTWEAYEAAPGETVVEMDPGMAFGTGTHETTRMCGQLLQKYVKAGNRTLDVGCGTGILSIIAAKLGASELTAVDIDGVAIRVAAENCRINQVEDKVKVFQGVLSDVISRQYDIVVANIIASVIVDIAGLVPRYLVKDGFFITSGIIRDRKDEVWEAYTGLGFEGLETIEDGEWVAMVFRWQGSL